jgi:leader peptidase (prepilin peptidase)/N-methyltransferase
MINAMEIWLIFSTLALLGLMFGSFAGASVWRLRARQLVEDKAAGEPVDKEEYDRLVPLSKETYSTDRSRCLHCGHVLAWHDLLPLWSWLSLRGRCRYCRTRIGKFELFMELGVALVFTASYLLWPQPLQMPFAVLYFGLWLSAVVLLAILFSYDLKWFLLPDRVVFPLMGVGIINIVVRLLGTALWEPPRLLVVCIIYYG